MTNFFSYIFLGGAILSNLLLFFKGVLIGICKIIPGVSGALLAVSFGVYQDAIDALINLKKDFFHNSRYLLFLCLGIIFGIILFGKAILFLMGKYYFYIMLLFIGLIAGSMLDFVKKIQIDVKCILRGIIFIIFIIISNIFMHNNNETIIMTCYDYFFAGIIEVFSSLVPGVSGTLLLMNFGYYLSVMELFAGLFSYSFFISNFYFILNFILGIMFGGIVFIILFRKIINKYNNLFNLVILELLIYSLFCLLFSLVSFISSIFSLFIGILLFLFGLFISKKLFY